MTVLAAAASAVACMGGDGGIEPGDARRLVLLPDDLPRVFERFDFGQMARADLRGAADRHGLELGRLRRR